MGWKSFAVRKNSEAMGASGILDKKRFMKEGEQVKRRKWLLAAMGGLSLLLARPVQAKTGELTLSQAARVYDARGIPTQYSFKKGAKVAYAGKPARAKHARYSFYKNGLEYALPVVTINHRAYYRLAAGTLLLASRVGRIDGHLAYAPWTTVTVTTADATYSDVDMKVGKKYLVDAYGYFDSNFGEEGGMRWYRVKGTSGKTAKYIYADNVAPAQRVHQIDYDRLGKLWVGFDAGAVVYTAAGTVQDLKGGTLSAASSPLQVDRRMYVWVPTRKKAVLFYHVKNAMSKVYFTDGHHYGYDSRADIGDGLVPAFLVKNIIWYGTQQEPFFGKMPAIVNTPRQARKEAKPATDKQRAALSQLLAGNEKTSLSMTYLLSDARLRENFTSALLSAKKTAQKASPSRAEVKFAIWRLEKARGDLNGKKVVVQNPMKFSVAEEEAVASLVERAKSGVYAKPRAYLTDHDTRLYVEDSKSGKREELPLTSFVSGFDREYPRSRSSETESSANVKDIAKDPLLAQYTQMILYQDTKTALVARTKTPLYFNKSGKYDYVDQLKLEPKGSLRAGQSLNLFVGPVCKLAGQYYITVWGKQPYFVKAQDVWRDDYSKSRLYQKYQKAIPKSGKAIIVASKKTYAYKYDRDGDLAKRVNVFHWGDSVPATELYVIKHDSHYYYCNGPLASLVIPCAKVHLRKYITR